MTGAPSQPPAGDHGSLAQALAQGDVLLGQDAALAREQALAILEVVPGEPRARLLLAVAQRMLGQAAQARALMQSLLPVLDRQPRLHFELGLACAALGDTDAAQTALRRAVALQPGYGDAWRALADQLTLAGDRSGADAAHARYLSASVKDPVLVEAALALNEDRIAVAEHLLREFLKRHPTDVAAIRMLAEAGTRLGRNEDASLLLERCLELAPGFTAARHNYAVVLHRRNLAPAALEQVAQLLSKDPENPGYLTLKAAALVKIGEYEEAIRLFESLLARYPSQPKAWMSYGHALKTVRRLPESIAAYEKSIALEPSLGEVWWSLANLKTFRFSAGQIDRMQHEVAREGLDAEDRFHLHFALGKAHEDAGNAEKAFSHYARGNALRRTQIDYDADEHARNIDRSIALFTPEFLASRAGQGCSKPDAIFIVGLPRSGSTLIEQILASHSQVEGTMELPDLVAMVQRLSGRRKKIDVSAYPEILAELDAAQLAALGEEYLERTRIQRKTGRPFFVDKLPNNFLHAGMIHLILPSAKIIDARRHPVGCCFSAFKQHFATGQHFSYSLEDAGRYYHDYVRLMAHFDTVLPGRVHRVIYEQMVADTEGEVRRLLAYCGLDFEPGCLRFYDNDRAVRTPSAEQVRQPIYTQGVDQWEQFRPWLDPLVQALGPVLDAWPDVPQL